MSCPGPPPTGMCFNAGDSALRMPGPGGRGVQADASQLVFLGPEAGVLAAGKGRRRCPATCTACWGGKALGSLEAGGGQNEGLVPAGPQSPCGEGPGVVAWGSGKGGVQEGCEGTGRGGSYSNMRAAKEERRSELLSFQMSASA